MTTPRSLLLAARMMLSPHSSWIHALENKATDVMYEEPFKLCGALAAYRAEMDEAEMKAARAVRDAIYLEREYDKIMPSITKAYAIAETELPDDRLREIIAKAKAKDAG